jgi:hypothetical protein
LSHKIGDGDPSFPFVIAGEGTAPLAELVQMIEQGGPDAVENAIEEIRILAYEGSLSKQESIQVSAVVRRAILECNMRHQRQWTGIMFEALLLWEKLNVKLTPGERAVLRFKLQAFTPPTDWSSFPVQEVIEIIDGYTDQARRKAVMWANLGNKPMTVGLRRRRRKDALPVPHSFRRPWRRWPRDIYRPRLNCTPGFLGSAVSGAAG